MALIEPHTHPEVCEYAGWGNNDRGGYVTMRCPHCGRTSHQELRGARYHRAMWCDGKQIKFFERSES
jgi:predicted RNA-binding Zn-ribbon protein involved in translation (DUF1610 family)